MDFVSVLFSRCFQRPAMRAFSYGLWMPTPVPRHQKCRRRAEQPIRPWRRCLALWDRLSSRSLQGKNRTCFLTRRSTTPQTSTTGCTDPGQRSLARGARQPRPPCKKKRDPTRRCVSLSVSFESWRDAPTSRPVGRTIGSHTVEVNQKRNAFFAVP